MAWIAHTDFSEDPEITQARKDILAFMEDINERMKRGVLTLPPRLADPLPGLIADLRGIVEAVDNVQRPF